MFRNILKVCMYRSCQPYIALCRCYAAGKPANNKKTSPKPSKKPAVNPHRTVKIYRFDGVSSKSKPRMQTFEVDVSSFPGKMVLDLLIKMKDMDPTLTFRRSCREGICGSCAMLLQGSNHLACIVPIPPDKNIEIYPLPHMYVQKDLVVDMTHFYKGYNSIRPYLIRHEDVKLGENQYAQSEKDNNKMVGLYECVLCACCSTSCPSYWWNGRRFLGPAALLHAYRWVIDSRDEYANCRMRDLRDDFKVFRCHTIVNCTLACPKGLVPSLAIALLKRLITGLEKKPISEFDTMKFFKKC